MLVSCTYGSSTRESFSGAQQPVVRCDASVAHGSDVSEAGGITIHKPVTAAQELRDIAVPLDAGNGNLCLCRAVPVVRVGPGVG